MPKIISIMDYATIRMGGLEHVLHLLQNSHLRLRRFYWVPCKHVPLHMTHLLFSGLNYSFNLCIKSKILRKTEMDFHPHDCQNNERHDALFTTALEPLWNTTTSASIIIYIYHPPVPYLSTLLFYVPSIYFVTVNCTCL